VEPPQDEPITKEIGNRTYLIANVEPLDVDGVRTVTVGAAAWLLAFVALLPFYGQLRDDDRGWWLWACLAGFGLGMLGLAYCRARRTRRRDSRTG
jgi:drug/metabolite transporter (DMT)-like permease